jgi:transposase-like protein
MTCAIFDDTSLGGMIVAAFDSGFLDEAECRRVLLRMLRPAPVCPGCQRSFTDAETERMLDGREIRCECGRKSAPRTGTVLENVHSDYRAVLLIACMSWWGIHRPEIATRCGVSIDTVRRITERLRVPQGEKKCRCSED